MVVSSCREQKNSRPLPEMALTNLAHFGEVRLIKITSLGYIWLMDNTEGSRVISQTYKARKNLELHLTTKQLHVVLGSILGDAYIHPKGKICFEQANSQKEYLFWKHSLLKSISYPKVSLVKRYDKRTKKTTISWRFYLRQYFRPLRKAFYNNKKKVIPMAIEPWVSPLLLAVWYMDDGSLSRRRYPLLMTECYTLDDLKIIQKILAQRYNLKLSITPKRRLRVSPHSRDKFFSLVRPHIHESLTYKLP